MTQAEPQILSQAHTHTMYGNENVLIDTQTYYRKVFFLLWNVENKKYMTIAI